MEKVKFITIETLLEMRENKEPFKLVEVLAEEEYQKGHIPGAMHIDVDELSEKAAMLLKKNETIVTYCASYGCHASTNAARMLLELGYGKVLDFKAGKRGWVHVGLDLEQ